MPPNQVICKKCGGLHGLDVWRDVEFYYCPKANRVLLVSKIDGLKTEEVSDEQQCEDGVGSP